MCSSPPCFFGGLSGLQRISSIFNAVSLSYRLPDCCHWRFNWPVKTRSNLSICSLTVCIFHCSALPPFCEGAMHLGLNRCAFMVQEICMFQWLIWQEQVTANVRVVKLCEMSSYKSEIDFKICSYLLYLVSLIDFVIAQTC